MSSTKEHKVVFLWFKCTKCNRMEWFTPEDIEILDLPFSEIECPSCAAIGMEYSHTTLNDS